MNEKLDCEIIRDLLPLCADNLESEKTKTAVEEHLKACAGCKEIFDSMKATENRKTQEEKREIDYLEKLRKNSKKGVIITVVVFCALLLCAFLARIFYPGSAVYPEDLESEISVSENMVNYTVSPLEKKKCITKIKAVQKGNSVYLTVFCAPKSLFGKESESGEYISSENIDAVNINGSLVWDNGYYTDSAEYKLWKNKTPYCGDITANLKIADAVGVSARFGSFSNELSTVNEPYGWRIFLKNPIEKQNEAAAKKSMKNEACAILSSIGNLGYVTFVYDVDGTEKRYTVNEKQASAYVGKNIKLCTGSLESTKELLQKLEIG